MSKRKALAQLEEHRRAVREAENRISECELAIKSATRRAETATSPLSDYFEAVAAGERDGSKAEEERLIEECRRAQEEAKVNVERAKGELRGAERGAVDRQTAEFEFANKHRAELIEELTERAEGAGDRLLATVREAQSAAGEWQTTRAEWSRLLERWGISPAELPQVPFTAGWQEFGRDLAPLACGVKRDPRRFIPMPASLVPGDWSEFEPAAEEQAA